MEGKHEEPMRGHGKFQQCLREWQQEAPGDKRWSMTRKGNIFSLLDHHHAPKLTPLFHPESDEEADKVIQEAEDVKAQLACLNMGLLKFNRKVDADKAEKSQVTMGVAKVGRQQAEKDWHMEAKEKAEREWQEQLAELAWVNQEVSSKLFSEFSF